MNTILSKHFSGLTYRTVKLKNNFVVSKFGVDTDIDYIYSITDEDQALLLNIETFGSIAMEEIAKLAKNQRIAMIDNKAMEMYIFNVSEEDIVTALFAQ
ncbi:hypothetical protein [Enterococcus mundtii]|uniref:hypothetical protein n=1 Tax=Enterococcus mundtii TaxID=53346 RepID=UPI001A96EE18|nr:hypothetical protein [Enterococcus mundtii]MBO1087202.1 hypothetical protein [Enterococcus mundtii]